MRNFVKLGVLILILTYIGCKAPTDSPTQSKSTSSADTTVVPMSLIEVSGGTFIMGSPAGNDDEIPLHTVTLSNFAISQTEITQGQWKAVMGANPTAFKTVGVNAPQDGVNWFGCVSFCNKLSISEGKTPCYSISGNTAPGDWTSGTITCNFSANGYRLPTEAEWEFAAIGGNKSKSYSYSGGNTITDIAWYSSNASATIHKTAQKSANELGIFDMSGNVAEWCWDWYGSYEGSAQTNPTGATTGKLKVLRGGSWNDSSSPCRCTARSSSDPAAATSQTGFRVVRAI